MRSNLLNLQQLKVTSPTNSNFPTSTKRVLGHKVGRFHSIADTPKNSQFFAKNFVSTITPRRGFHQSPNENKSLRLDFSSPIHNQQRNLINENKIKQREVMVNFKTPESLLQFNQRSNHPKQDFKIKKPAKLKSPRDTYANSLNSPELPFLRSPPPVPMKIFGVTDPLRLPKSVNRLYDKHIPQRLDVLDSSQNQGFFPKHDNFKRKSVRNSQLDSIRHSIQYQKFNQSFEGKVNNSYNLEDLSQVYQSKDQVIRAHKNESYFQDRNNNLHNRKIRPKIQQQPKRARLLLPTSSSEGRLPLNFNSQKALAFVSISDYSLLSNYMYQSFLDDFNQESQSYRSAILHLQEFMGKVSTQANLIQNPVIFINILLPAIADFIAKNMPSVSGIFEIFRDLLTQSLFINSAEIKQRRQNTQMNISGKFSELYLDGYSYFEELNQLQVRNQKAQQKIEKWKIQRQRKGNLTKMLKSVASKYYSKW